MGECKDLLTTFECTILLDARAGDDGVLREKLAGFGGAVFCSKDAAAATERPTLDRTVAKGARRKIDENRLATFNARCCRKMRTLLCWREKGLLYIDRFV